MSTTPSSPALTSALTAAVVSAAALLAWLVARAARRSERAGARHRTAALFRAMTGRLAGNVPIDALRTAAKAAASDHFWGAIEAMAATLRRRERMQLAASLARNRHILAERRALRRDDSPTRRELAARRLGLLPAMNARPVLRRALVRGPEPVRLAAARSLAATHDLATLDWLCRHPAALATRPLPALSGLLRSFGPGARARLITALDQGVATPRFECAVMDALGISRCRSARDRLQARLRSENIEVRVAAARALGRLGMGEAIPALLLALGDGAWPVRAQAAHALGRLRAAPAVEALTLAVGDGAWWVRHHAAYALAAIGAEGRDALCELVVRSPDPYAREMAREALDQSTQRHTA